MWEMLLNSKAGANLAGSLGQGLGSALGGGGPMVSGGSVDAKSWMDGSGWTVSTGSSKASGGDRSGGANTGAAPAAASPFQPQQAGMNWLLLLAFGSVLWAFVRK